MLNAPLRDSGTLGKAMDVLEVIAHCETPLRFTDLLALVDQPRGRFEAMLQASGGFARRLDLE